MDNIPVKVGSVSNRDELRKTMADAVSAASGFAARRVLGDEGLKLLKAFQKTTDVSDAFADLVLSNYEG